MELANNINTRLNIRPEVLEGFFIREAMRIGNGNLAKDMGIHPTSCSRDKPRILKLAVRMICRLGLPPGSYSPPDSDVEEVMMLTRDEVRKLKAVADFLKEKTPAVTEVLKG
ncbi:hypothetical protein [Pluralibacter gergoviae]|uniref:hypothetical protein n=1 Tax=Pluralibacter gergoviae TaxID=61647 RepID=UPI0006AC1C7D|nr:hypothetical protein [Pluralibacter gergoviae]KOQ95790.1 hypothetical protein ABW48_16245 [Pluralibacter gergoviae]